MNRLLLRATGVVAAASLGFAATGCCGSDPEPTAKDTPTKSADTQVPWISFEQSEPGGDGALITGKLVEKSGCLAVQSDGSDEVWFLAFSTSDPRPEKLAVGDNVELGGGFHEDAEALSGHDYIFPESCGEGVDKLAVVALE
ncbi:MAG: hypothetical protein ACTII7_02105 [Galactobacter sp.]